MSIVVENVLDAVHYVLEHNEFRFTEKQILLADEFITPYISELDIDPKEFNVKTIGAPKLANDKRIVPIIIKYFAFLEQNMALYEELKEEGYIFYENHSIKFYALDRLLTGNFKKNDYKKLLFKYEGAISRFYSSIRGLERDEKEKYCKEFSDIVLRDQTTLKVGYRDDEEEPNHYNFLIKKNIELFGKDFLLGLSQEQREMINNMCVSIQEDDAVRIKELFTSFPEYNNKFSFNSELLKYFSIEEISTMSNKDSRLYDAALKVNLLERMKRILKLDPEFDCPSAFIKEEIFRVLSDEEIVGLTSVGKSEIADINIPEIDNVLVMPIKKINKIVAKDKKRKALLEKQESTDGIKK